MTDVFVIARMAWQEALRRRVLAVVGVLTVLSGALYVVGCISIRNHLGGVLDARTGIIRPIVPATMLGLASFATLFLGSVLAVFLTAGAVRGDVDRGLVQPLVVRPVGRSAYLAGRGLAAAVVSAGYVAVIFLAATLTTRLVFSELPPNAWSAVVPLVGAVLVVTVLTLLMSCVLSTVATGISVLMAYGAGLVAGLLGEIGRNLNASTVTRIADSVSYALPFEALYRDALSRLSPGGLVGELVQLGPLGGARSGGATLWLFIAVYVAGLAVLAAWKFARTDL